MKKIAASEFKAKCLALLDEVAKDGTSMEILKRGKPVAHLVPTFVGEFVGGKKRFPQDSLKGTVTVVGDIIEPVLPASAWDVLKK